MALTIPAAWLVSHNVANGWRFQCSTNLRHLVSTNRAAIYFRQLVSLLENEHHLVDFHLKIRHNYRRNNKLEVFIFFGDPERVCNPSSDSVCISCDLTHKLGRASLLSEQEYTRAWLDGRGRPKLILTPIRHVERLSELNDDNGELAAFWRDTVDLIDRECSGSYLLSKSSMILNHGTYRNHAHLHLKINFNEEIWNSIIVPRYQDKIKEMDRLAKQPDSQDACFGRNQLKNMVDQMKNVKIN